MPKKKRKSSFVPRLLVRTAIAGVIPACALACSSNDSGPGATDTGVVQGVADAAYGDTHFGVADTAYRDSLLGVADVAYPDASVADIAYPDTSHAETTADAPGDAPSEASDGGSSDVFGVAAVAYPAYESGTPG